MFSLYSFVKPCPQWRLYRTEDYGIQIWSNYLEWNIFIICSIYSEDSFSFSVNLSIWWFLFCFFQFKNIIKVLKMDNVLFQNETFTSKTIWPEKLMVMWIQVCSKSWSTGVEFGRKEEGCNKYFYSCKKKIL